MADDSAPKAEAEAPPEPSGEKPPEAEAKAADQGPSDAGEATPVAEAETEEESDIESTTATEHEETDGAADASSTMTSASAAEEEPPPPEIKKSTSKGTTKQSATSVKGKSNRTLADQNKSVERLSQSTVKKIKADGKKKSKTLLFDKTTEEKKAEQPAAKEREPAKDEAPPPAEGAPAVEPAPSKVEVEEKPPKIRSKGRVTSSPSQEGKYRLMPHTKRVTVVRSKGDFEGKPRFQNSYRLDSKKPFNVDRVYNIIKTTVDKALQDVRYNPDECAKLVAFMSNEIKSKVKLQAYERYKIAVQVIIGEKKEQSIYSVMRFLWDVERDHYSFYSYENTTLFAIALALGVYYE